MRTTHPSYGIITIHRTHGGNQVLFGSPIKHSEVICISIYEGECKRNEELHYDSFRPVGNKPIIEVQMSCAQFAQAITSFNLGCGTPCTIDYRYDQGRIERCNFVDKRQEIEDEFTKKMKVLSEKLKDNIKEAEEILGKKSLNKEDRQRLTSIIIKVYNFFSDSCPFVQSQFLEAMDKTTAVAKAEIYAFAEMMAKSGEAISHEGKTECLTLPKLVSTEHPNL